LPTDYYPARRGLRANSPGPELATTWLAGAVDLDRADQDSGIAVPNRGCARRSDRGDHILAVSRSVFTTLPAELRAKASAVYNGVQTPERNAVCNSVRIGMAGPSVSEKGMHLFLDTVVPLMDRYDFDVSIWGLWSSKDLGLSDDLGQRVVSDCEDGVSCGLRFCKRPKQRSPGDGDHGAPT
jgi:hypothetical protein